ncbi:MAG: IS66 family insertion sequence element accessory protein TnpB [Bacteriovoracaceae bacterium]|nr:IS66 family insertion sequence element accessory protein TnpB [Bacteriovoracaceae bacterium]
MKSIDQFEKIYLHRRFADFRKSINGLSEIVQDSMNLDPFKKYLFVFCNRKCDRLKILYWDNSGFALWYKRLEEEKFIWPKHFEDDVLELTSQSLDLLLDGIQYWKMKPHRILHYESVN